MTLEMVTHLTATFITGSVLFIAQIIQQGTRDTERAGEGERGIMAVLNLLYCGSCGSALQNVALKQDTHTHTHTHTHTF